MNATPQQEPAAAGSADPPLRSRLYSCRVMHHRLAPKAHRFEHEFFLFCLDLAEIDRVAAAIPLFRRNRPGLYSFYDRDHLPLSGGGDVRSNLLAFLNARNIPVPAEPRIELVTFPRMLGYVFNPVSFCFVTAPGGEPVCAVAEVSNTFREMKPFIIPPDGAAPDGSPLFRLRAPKNFYVSPFFDVEDGFDFRLALPGPRLDLRVNTLVGGKPALIATLQGNPLPLTTRNLLRQTLRVPFVTLKVILLIHFHALVLLLKRVPLRWKHEKAERQTGLFNPHRTLQTRT